MSRPGSKVKRPMAAPDGTFPLLEKDGVKKHSALKHEIYRIDRGMYFEFGFEATYVTSHGYVTIKNEESLRIQRD